MSEKYEPPKPQKPPKTAAEKATWGRMAPVRYPDSLGKRIGGWLAGLLTPWGR